MIKEERATDMAVYLLSKDRHGEMHYKKLMGLMYLSERKFMKNHPGLICDDYFEAKEHGPVLSETYKLMEGTRKPTFEVWDSEKKKDVPFDIWSSKINKLDDDDYISVKEILTEDSMNQLWLSPVNIETMDDIWEEFGHLSERELREYIQENCPEWKATRRLNGRTGKIDESYEDKQSFPDEITAEAIGKQQGMTEGGINAVKRDLDPWWWGDEND